MTQRPEAPWRLDSPIHGPADGAMDLPPGWTGLANCTLTEAQGRSIPVPLALLHPEVGVALIGVPASLATEVEAALRQRLEAARFSAIFAGHLPVLALARPPDDPSRLESWLLDAFAKVPPLAVAGGDGWISVVRRALLSRPMIRLVSPPPPSPDAEQPAAAVPPPAPARRQRRRRGWALPLAGLAGIGVVAGLVIGFGGTPVDTNSGAEVPPQPAASQRTDAPPAAAPSPLRGPAAPQASPAPAPVPPPAALTPPAEPVLSPPAGTAPARAPSPEPMPPPQSASTALPPPPAPPPLPARATVTELPRVQVRTAANLRERPDNSATIRRVAQRGEIFRVHNEAFGGWTQVGDAAPEGWIHSSLLVDAAP